MKKLTNDFGNIIADNQNSLSAGAKGPLLMQDYLLLEKLAHQNRERIRKNSACKRKRSLWRNKNYSRFKCLYQS